VVADDGLPHDEGLEDDVVDLPAQALDADPLGGQVLEHRGERAFVALAEIRVIALEVLGVLVYGVVCEVHAERGQVLGPGDLVGDGGKAGHALAVDVEPQGVAAQHEDVDPEVKLEAVDQVGLA
jgi:hypothetical protein